MPASRGEHLLLVRIRRSIRALNSALERGAAAARLTRQQQALLLAIEALGGTDVPFARVRAELGLDPASGSILLAHLIRARLVRRARAADRRAMRVSLTAVGRARFLRSARAIRRQLHAADERHELDALHHDLRTYLR